MPPPRSRPKKVASQPLLFPSCRRLFVAFSYGSPSPLPAPTKKVLEPLMLMHRSLIASGQKALAGGPLVDTIRRIRCFGLCLAPLDLRQVGAFVVACDKGRPRKATYVWHRISIMPTFPWRHPGLYAVSHRKGCCYSSTGLLGDVCGFRPSFPADFTKCASLHFCRVRAGV